MPHSALYRLIHNGKNPNWLFYLRAVAREAVPDAVWRSRLEAELRHGADAYDEDYVADRVDYYCKLSAERPAVLGDGALRLADFHKRGNLSAYYYDARRTVAYFDPQLRWQYLFGDVRDIPASPTIVKSRDLTEDNANSVLLKMDSNRHYIYVDDPYAIDEKESRAVFRGFVGSRPNRLLFMERYGSHPRVDAAGTPSKSRLRHQDAAVLTIADHLRYRYIMCLEGNDVASNLKWVMSSHSLAVMPRPTCETWFMEGRLVAGVHYVEVRDDYTDLIEKMDYFDSHPDEARAIVDNANRWVAQFRDSRRELYISLRVMQKYFSLVDS